MKKTGTSKAKGQGIKVKEGRSGVDRILVGVRIEPRLVKVMKALAELHDCALGELIEKVFLHAMDGGNGLVGKGKMSVEARNQINSLKEVYGVDYEASALAKPQKNTPKA